MVPISVLDLSPIAEGETVADSLRHTRELAEHCERLGYHRFWLAEHHGMPGIASAATALLMQLAAAATKTLRVGAGGIMLPNHAPLVIAEQFGTLDALFPGRIDLGLGRAPGSDSPTMRALRRNLATDPAQFPRDVVELMHYFDVPDAGQPVVATPGAGAAPQFWILGSSRFGAELAAALGLPYAFASHFAPAQLMDALDAYRTHFKPSEFLDKPHVMLGYNTFAADTQEDAEWLATSMQQAFVNLRRGTPGKLQPPVKDYAATLSPQERALLAQVLACSAIGTRDVIREKVAAFIALTQADELIIASQIFDHDARLRSYELTAQALIPGAK